MGLVQMGSEEFSSFLRFFFRFSALFRFLRFSSFFFAFLRFSSLFSHSPRGQGQMTAIYCKNGNFTPTPSALTPCGTSRKQLGRDPSKLGASCRPRAQGVGVDPCLLTNNVRKRLEVSEMASAKTASAIASVSTMWGRY